MKMKVGELFMISKENLLKLKELLLFLVLLLRFFIFLVNGLYVEKECFFFYNKCEVYN